MPGSPGATGSRSRGLWTSSSIASARAGPYGRAVGRSDRFVAIVEARRTGLLLGLCGGALLIGATFSVALGDDLRFWDERCNYAIATNLHQGNGFSADGTTETAFRPPGYPFLLVPF